MNGREMEKEREKEEEKEGDRGRERKRKRYEEPLDGVTTKRRYVLKYI